MGRIKVDRSFIAGLSLDSGKIAMIVGKPGGGNIEVLALEKVPGGGIKQGKIINMEKALESIAQAREALEKKLDVSIDRAIVGITGEHITGVSSKGFVGVDNPGLEIKKEDVEKALELARAISVPTGREVIYVHPNSFTVDEQKGIKEPVGMIGVRLEAQAYIVTAQSTVLRNIEKTLKLAGIKPINLVFQPIAASLAVLGEDEMIQGTGVIDIGKETTSVALWYEGELIHTAVIPIGGDHITSDIAIGLRISKSYAETIKIRESVASSKLVKSDEQVKIEDRRGKKSYLLEKKILAAIIEPRVEEILEFAHKEIMRSGLADRLAGGIFLVGGTSNLPGIVEVAEEIFNLPVSPGRPWGFIYEGKPVEDPSLASCLGLLRMAQLFPDEAGFDEGGSLAGIGGFLKKVWIFIKENF